MNSGDWDLACLICAGSDLENPADLTHLCHKKSALKLRGEG